MCKVNKNGRSIVTVCAIVGSKESPKLHFVPVFKPIFKIKKINKKETNFSLHSNFTKN